MTQTFCGWAMLEPDARRPLRVWMRVGRGPGRASARAFTGGALASGTLAGAMIPRRRCCRRPHPTILAAATLAAAGCRSLSVAGPRRTPSSLPRLRRPAVLAPRPPPFAFAPTLSAPSSPPLPPAPSALPRARTVAAALALVTAALLQAARSGQRTKQRSRTAEGTRHA